MSMIEIEDVHKRYRKDATVVRALDGVTLTIDRGEFVAILGPSGSGKSTLLHLLGLLDRADQGTYRLDGRDVATFSADELAACRNRRIGFVFQSFHLLPKTPAIENVELPLLYSDRADLSGLAMKALDRVGLVDRAAHVPGELSGGQQQRVAIARALVTQPRVILADEPTGNLDSRTSLEIIALFQELGAAGMTIVYVTHEQEIARFASRIITVRDGLLAEDVRQQPVLAAASIERAA